MQNVKQTYKLFLDDVRMPSEAYSYTGFKPFMTDDWIIVRNYDEFILKIKVAWEKYSFFPELIAFDHDLADEHYCPPAHWDNYSEWEKFQDFKEKNGFACAEWLTDFCIDNDLKLPEWFCHSMNPAGKDNINFLLKNFKKHQDGTSN